MNATMALAIAIASTETVAEPEVTAKRLIAKLAELGYQVTPRKAAAA